MDMFKVFVVFGGGEGLCEDKGEDEVKLLLLEVLILKEELLEELLGLLFVVLLFLFLYVSFIIFNKLTISVYFKFSNLFIE